MKTGFYSHPLFLEHDTGAHPENAERLRAIRNRLQSEGILDQLELRSGRQATSLDISMLHSEDLFEQVRQASEEGRQNLQSPDCVVSEQTFSAALQAVGSVLEAVEEVAERRLDNAFCAVRPPGHHAERDQAMGFCFFNNIALAAEYLTRSLGYKRVLIFDFDVHHGNGTQHLFEERDDVFFISTHQDPRSCYPGTGYSNETGRGPGSGFTRNLPLPPWTEDAAYLDQVEHQLLPLLIEYAPDFILVSAGFDAHRDDPLASLNLTDIAFTKLTERLKLQASESAGGRMVSILEGGYDVQALSLCVHEHLKVLSSD